MIQRSTLYKFTHSKLNYLKGHVLIFIISFLLMLPGFYRNIWMAASPSEISRYGIISESMMVGRLAESQKNGLFSSGGFIGFAMQKNDSCAVPEKQYEIYKRQIPYKNFSVYKTISGTHAFILGLIDKMSGFSNSFNIQLFRFMNSVLLSLSLSFLLLFIFHYFGIIPFVFALSSIMFSVWLTVFASNIYFALWAFFLPLITVLSILSVEDLTGTYSQYTALWLLFAGIFIKCLINGFEFISTAMVMMMVPLVFFLILRRWPIKLFFRRALTYSAVAIAGIILYMALLALQISIYEGSANAGLDHILKSWQKRTSGKNTNYNFAQNVNESLLVKTSDVIISQLKDKAYRLHTTIGYFGIMKIKWRITYFELVLGFLFSSLVLFFLTWFDPDERINRKSIALLGLTLISFFAPMTWFVIFKGHTNIHVQLDHLAWHMPFVIFGFALVGLTIQRTGSFLISSYSSLRKRS